MHVIEARNVNTAYRYGLNYLMKAGERLPDVIRAPEPVVTIYRHPQERVLMNRQRDLNPFFHLFEALWMLNGQDDIDTLEQFVDDTTVLGPAYGHRWRHWPASEPYDNAWKTVDQMRLVVEGLRMNPDDRRIVISMWDPRRDLGSTLDDTPHSLTAKVGIVKGRLKMIVFDRASDIILDTYGAGAVHMTMLQEYLAAMLHVEIGTYTQVSTDYYAHLTRPYFLNEYFPFTDELLTIAEPYADMRPFPLVHNREYFDAELETFMGYVTGHSFIKMDVQEHVQNFHNRFFPAVAMPMYLANQYIREGAYADALETLISRFEHFLNPYPIDWICASAAWIERKMRIYGAQR